jgi:hypothetical protein
LSESNANLGLKQLEEAVKIDPHNALLFANLVIGSMMPNVQHVWQSIWTGPVPIPACSWTWC